MIGGPAVVGTEKEWANLERQVGSGLRADAWRISYKGRVDCRIATKGQDIGAMVRVTAESFAGCGQRFPTFRAATSALDPRPTPTLGRGPG